MSVKQVIVARTDLNLSAGKLAAQVAHAAVNATEDARSTHTDAYDQWMDGQYTKIVLGGEDAQQVQELADQAQLQSLPSALITDAGHTEIPAGTITAVAIGPAESEQINAVTGDLPLYER